MLPEHTRAFEGYDTLLERFTLNASTKEPVPLWPDEWVEQRGTRLFVRRGAPRGALILPLSVTPTAVATDFTLRSVPSTASGVPFETIEPDLEDPAYIHRWLSAPFRVGAALWAFNTSNSGEVALLCRFYFGGDCR